MEYEPSNADLSFGLSLMSHLGLGNVSISPVSIRTALAMLYEGARGESAKEIARVAGISERDEERRSGYQALTDALDLVSEPDGVEGDGVDGISSKAENVSEERGGRRVPYRIKGDLWRTYSASPPSSHSDFHPNVGYKLSFANGLWVADQFPVRPEFPACLHQFYGAQVEQAQFRQDPEWERSKINKWVSEKTQQKIPELFPGGSITPNSVIALANALYFKAPWEDVFNQRFTQKQDFHLPSGEAVKVVFMRKGKVSSPHDLPEFLYGSWAGGQIVKLPYKFGLLAKVILLPPEGKGVEFVEARLKDGSTTIANLLSKLKSEEFSRLEIPRVEVKGDYDLGPPLRAMGIEQVFDQEQANLGGVGPGNIFVSDGVHKTYFKTDEQGSEGAAATGFTARCCSATVYPHPPIEFVADRPHLEVVVESQTNAVLFLNRIVDPR